jgi:hypothetical protein
MAEVTISNCNSYLLGLEFQAESNIKTWDRNQADTIRTYLLQIKKSEIELAMLKIGYADSAVQQKK